MKRNLQETNQCFGGADQCPALAGRGAGGLHNGGEVSDGRGMRFRRWRDRGHRIGMSALPIIIIIIIIVITRLLHLSLGSWVYRPNPVRLPL